MYRLLTVITVITISRVCGKAVNIISTVDVEDYPRYAFNYAVSDPYTKDNKAQWEERDGDRVVGGYSLREPDGNVRVVEYSASDGQGFNAVVKNLAPNIHPVQVLPSKQLSVPVSLQVKVPAAPIAPIIEPVTYGFGAAPLAIGLPKTTLFQESSLALDPVTGSYGGWVPSSTGPYAYVISKKIINGRLRKRVIGPISLINQKLIIRRKKND